MKVAFLISCPVLTEKDEPIEIFTDLIYGWGVYCLEMLLVKVDSMENLSSGS